ncbi:MULTISPECIES: amidohydrolase [Hyphomonas]|mgnify:FL=1|uniref:Amidohydrolase n=1 Tax=Hyphomonas adhaerens TaxID=81029 RepID=A0A3B9H228_9PROT|nr:MULTISPECIES: amidohydrolase [Hyphomonas]MBB39213.1 amidohydrolase [Hyphomonas sp.]HAE28749.1 amidohydrolase [Hyphomonas adhaerens]|tara:strand:- start:5528 stop:7210 length:1683 start_codon:yes stop_codon:yes gene_type:complete
MLRIASLALALTLAACSAGQTPEAAETEPAQRLTVFTGGTIYTGNPDLPTVDAVVVGEDGRIVGTAPPLSEDWDEAEIDLVDLKGAYMYPGFTDAHAHLMGIGQRELNLSLEGTASIDELVTRIEAELVGMEPGVLLFGRGWIETGWPEGRMPSAADLDAVSPDNPVILIRSDGHALVANSAAMDAVGITDETENPDGGAIERDADGHATGMLIDNAMALVAPLRSQPDAAAKARALETGAEVYVSRGWTGVHNMSVGPDEAPIMQELAGEGKMPLRLWNAFDATEDGMALAAAQDYETPTITNHAIKLYMDGALGSRGAQLIKPYSDRPDTSGLSLITDEDLADFMSRADESGIQVAIHAIGDLANQRILDIYEAGGYPPEKRWRIEHTQILAPDDIARVGDLGLIASMQPSHAIGDLHFAPSRLGMDRLAGAYAWKALIDDGAVVAGGSDAPVEVGSPLIEFYAAVARKDLKGFEGEGWHPEQKLTREQALALFTSAAAYAAFQEDDLGTIEAGKLADFTVFDIDLMTVPEAEILDAKTVMTVVGGKIVYDSSTAEDE